MWWPDLQKAPKCGGLVLHDHRKTSAEADTCRVFGCLVFDLAHWPNANTSVNLKNSSGIRVMYNIWWDYNLGIFLSISFCLLI